MNSPSSAWLVVNGTGVEVPLDPDRSLLVVLREELGLVGAKYGCGEGACGACTVLIDGHDAEACVVTVADAAGRSITTVEGLVREGRLHPVQQALVEIGGVQCGYCAPGMVMRAVALLAESPDPDDHLIAGALDVNVCRCGAYPRIARAVRRAAELMRGTDGGLAASVPVADGETLGAVASGAPWDLSAASSVPYFELLGDGLVVTGAPTRAAPDSWLPAGGATVHVGADGMVTALTGKVDVGQGNRTALSLLVAEELRVPRPAVRLIMGDTDVCPYDVGTFGSRSMPDAGEALRAVSASARQVLEEMAAERWGVGRSRLRAAQGAIARPGTSDRLTYAELLDGVRRVEPATAEPPLTPATDWTVAGRPTAALGAVAAVTGAARFASDITLPGMLHGAVLRPPAHGATLRAADLSGLDATPEVIAVHEGPFVGVAAPSTQLARRALAAVDAHWDLQPQPGEAALLAHLRTHPVDTLGWEGPHHDEKGDVDAAMDAAPHRLAETYTTAYIAHVPLETRVVVADWQEERLIVWTGTQQPFGVRALLAEAFGIPETRIRVIVPMTGGGFGGKHTAEAAVEAARLARVAGRPVKVAWTREEEFSWGYLRPAAIIDIRSAAADDGTITAWELSNINSGTAAIGCPYDIANQRVAFQPAASPLPQGPYRALAATANTFARESHLDEIAHLLGADPVELRLRHLSDERLASVLAAAAERAGWAGGGPGGGVGRGIAAGIEKGGRVATCAEVRVEGDGRLDVTRIVTAFECGAVVDPDNLANQIEGATIMGLGGALFESVHFDRGRILNPSMQSYRVPRFSDVPPIDVVVLDRRDLPPAGGGETPITAVAPALANAVFGATGRRIRSLPLAPDGRIA